MSQPVSEFKDLPSSVRPSEDHQLEALQLHDIQMSGASAGLRMQRKEDLHACNCAHVTSEKARVRVSWHRIPCWG